jgi:hypothetical protein
LTPNPTGNRQKRPPPASNNSDGGTPLATDHRVGAGGGAVPLPAEVDVMIHTEPSPSPAAQVRREHRVLRVVAAFQGAYFVATGLWPLFGINSFQALTGPKVDLWRVYTVGVLVTVIGATVLLAAVRRRVTPEVVVLAIGSAVALAGIDVIFVVRGVISWVYLVDAAAQVALIAGWTAALRSAHSARAPQYPHLEAMLARGRSIPPNGNGSAYRSGSNDVGGAAAYSSSGTSR